MNAEQAKVRQFMQEVKSLDLPTKPGTPAFLMQSLCMSMMTEELGELAGAMTDNNMVEIADGLADLLYVVYYTANCYGLDMEPIFSEVHRSNMTKKGGAKRQDGKQLKGPDYSPPDLASILEAQR